jgi:hypothetical protein
VNDELQATRKEETELNMYLEGVAQAAVNTCHNSLSQPS